MPLLICNPHQLFLVYKWELYCKVKNRSLDNTTRFVIGVLLRFLRNSNVHWQGLLNTTTDLCLNYSSIMVELFKPESAIIKFESLVWAKPPPIVTRYHPLRSGGGLLPKEAFFTLFKPISL